MAAARFEQVTTLTAFDWTYNPEIPAAQLRDLGTCAFLRRHESVILAGAVGLGKSHLAQALGYAACQQGYHVAYRKAPGLLADLSGGHADGTYERRLRAYFQPDLLIVDDFGLREFTPQQSEDLYELVCQRDQHKSWILVSNRLPQDGSCSRTRCSRRASSTGWSTPAIMSSYKGRVTGRVAARG